MNKKGFTIVDFIIVITILGILTAMVIARFSEASNQDKYNRVLSFYHWDKNQVDLWREVNNVDAFTFSHSTDWQTKYRDYVASLRPLPIPGIPEPTIDPAASAPVHPEIEEHNAGYWRGYADGYHDAKR